MADKSQYGPSSMLGLVPASYGEAQSRVTKTPIKFKQGMKSPYQDADPGAPGGSYMPPGYNSGDPEYPGGYMYVNTAPFPGGEKRRVGDVGAVVRHESVHSLLDPELTSVVMAAQADPGVGVRKSLVQDRRAGKLYNEAPAYSSVYSPADTPSLTPELRQQYLGKLFDLLSASPSNAGLVNQLKRLMQPGYNPANPGGQ